MGYALKTSELPRSKTQEISHKVSIFWISLAKPTSGHIPGGMFSGTALVWRGMAWQCVAWWGGRGVVGVAWRGVAG